MRHLTLSDLGGEEGVEELGSLRGGCWLHHVKASSWQPSCMVFKLPASAIAF